MGEDVGAREARYAEAIEDILSDEYGTFLDGGTPSGLASLVAPGVAALVDAEVAAAVSEAQAEQAKARAESYEDGYDQGHADAHADGAADDMVCRQRRRAESAEAEVERLREFFNAEADWLNAHHDGSLVTSDYPMIARRLRALLATSLAAEMGSSTDAATTARPYASDIDRQGETTT